MQATYRHRLTGEIIVLRQCVDNPNLWGIVRKSEHAGEWIGAAATRHFLDAKLTRNGYEQVTEDA